MLIYIDESGHPHPNDSTTRPVLVALCMKETAHRDVTRQLHRYKRDLIGREDPWDMKGRRLLAPRVCSRNPRKWELVQRVFELIDNTDLHVFGVIMQRPGKLPFSKQGILPIQHQRLLQRINLHCELHSGGSEMAVLVYDGQGMAGVPSGLSTAISHYLFTNYRGRTYNRILDTPLFVDSEITPGIQLADMVASCVRKYHENELDHKSPGGDPFLSAIDRFYRIVTGKTMKLEAGEQTLYGLYYMPERYFYLPEEEIPEEIDQEDNSKAAKD